VCNGSAGRSAIDGQIDWQQSTVLQPPKKDAGSTLNAVTSVRSDDMSDTKVTTAGTMGILLQARPTSSSIQKRETSSLNGRLFWRSLVRCGPVFLLACAASFWIQYYFAKNHAFSIQPGVYKDLAGLLALELVFALAGSFAAAALISSWAQRFIADETIPVAAVRTHPPPEKPAPALTANPAIKEELPKVTSNADSAQSREEELVELHRKLLETSRHAGMAEVASGVLHNVGNVLNSVNISCTVATERLGAIDIGSLRDSCVLLKKHESDLSLYLTTDPKGRQLPGFLGMLSVEMAAEKQAVAKELDSLRKNIDHIKEIVAMQQEYAKVSGVVEILPVSQLVEDALRLNAGALVRHEVDVVRRFENVPNLPVDKHRVLQILVNLIRNAKYALDESGRKDKILTVRIARNVNNHVKIEVQDNGIGIPPENLPLIFRHGFTTRRDGHGFGLHSGSLAAQEMGGSLWAYSAGPGKGATFTLELPSKPRNREAGEIFHPA
jgi:signal transduction histidine kinase